MFWDKLVKQVNEGCCWVNTPGLSTVSKVQLCPLLLIVGTTAAVCI